MPFVYLLRCADGTLYVGHTEDLGSREKTHNDGRGAVYTAARLAVRMVYAEEHASLKSAIGRERQVKRWTTQKKEALIAGDFSTLKQFSKRRKKKAPKPGRHPATVAKDLPDAPRRVWIISPSESRKWLCAVVGAPCTPRTGNREPQARTSMAD